MTNSARLFAAIATLLVVADTRASLLFYEPFSTSVYTNGTPIGSGSIGQWTLGNAAGAGSSTVSGNAALSFSGLVTSNASFGLLRAANSTSNNRHAGASLSSPQSLNAGNPTVYGSFLLNVQAAPSGNRCVAALSSSTGTTPNAGAAVWINGSKQLLVSKNSTTPAAGTSGVLADGTHFIVVRYKYNSSSSDDEVALWLDPNPSTFGTNESNIPASNVWTTANSDITSIAAIYAPQGQASGAGTVWGSSSGTIWMDEVRVGTTWADVTPLGEYTPPPPPWTNAPVFTEVFLTAEGLAMRGTNGSPNGGFDLLGASDPAQPINQWALIITNKFDGAGNFDFTNTVTAGVSAKFYRLRIANGSSSSNAVAPGITSQPQDQSAPVGGAAQFSVTATGSEPLFYQWYFNTNTLLTDKTNATLIISTVSSNDAGRYSVTVWNDGGSTNSAFALLTIAEPPTDGDYFVSTTGSDSNPGTMEQPFATVAKAVSVATPGDVIYVRGGTYFPTSTITINFSGTDGNTNKLWAYPGEKPVLDFVGQALNSNNRGILFTTNANYWHIKGLEITRAGDNGIKVEGSHNTFDLLVLHHNRDTGLQIGFTHDAVNDVTKASYNFVINCDSYLNFDPPDGQDADAFACKLHAGEGNMFVGCRGWRNSDDGWDLFESDAAVVISNCWTWHNGDASLFSAIGNGNGFKLGGNGSGGTSKGTHQLINCVAFNNNFPGRTAHGIDQNSHKGGLIILNCLSFNNIQNYFIEESAGANPQIVRNCVSFNGLVSKFGSGTIEDHNTWVAGPDETDHAMINPAVGSFGAGDFNNLTEAAASAPRQPDGSLPTGFARLLAGSNLIDKGTNVGIPFFGSAPDLGAYEYQP